MCTGFWSRLYCAWLYKQKRSWALLTVATGVCSPFTPILLTASCFIWTNWPNWWMCSNKSSKERWKPWHRYAFHQQHSCIWAFRAYSNSLGFLQKYLMEKCIHMLGQILSYWPHDETKFWFYFYCQRIHSNKNQFSPALKYDIVMLYNSLIVVCFGQIISLLLFFKGIHR